jgi:hypothetical protein
MANEVKLTFEGKTYTLAFNRNTARQLERAGFTSDGISTTPVTSIPMLFSGAFLKNHRYVKPEIIDKIFEQTSRKSELISTLAGLYAETVNTLFDEPEENEGNASWETN